MSGKVPSDQKVVAEEAAAMPATAVLKEGGPGEIEAGRLEVAPVQVCADDGGRGIHAGGVGQPVVPAEDIGAGDGGQDVDLSARIAPSVGESGMAGGASGSANPTDDDPDDEAPTPKQIHAAI